MICGGQETVFQFWPPIVRITPRLATYGRLSHKLDALFGCIDRVHDVAPIRSEADMSKLILDDVEIEAVKEGAEYFGQIRRSGKVRHFQPAGTHHRIFSVLVGPWNDAASAIGHAEASVEAGDWER
jgi:hypothetical protein